MFLASYNYWLVGVRVFGLSPMMPGLVCPLCPYEQTSELNLNLRSFLQHIQLFHSHQPSFCMTCGLNGCLRTFTNFRVFRNHVYAFHNGSDPTNVASVTDVNSHGDSESEDTVDDDPSIIESSNTEIVSSDLQMFSAQFLLGLKEQYKLTQNALQGIIEGVSGLVQCRLSVLHTEVCKKTSS